MNIRISLPPDVWRSVTIAVRSRLMDMEDDDDADRDEIENLEAALDVMKIVTDTDT